MDAKCKGCDEQGLTGGIDNDNEPDVCINCSGSGVVDVADKENEDFKKWFSSEKIFKNLKENFGDIKLLEQAACKGWQARAAKEMTEERAKEILGNKGKHLCCDGEGTHFSKVAGFISKNELVYVESTSEGSDTITWKLDELKALIWWMENKCPSSV